MTQQGFFSSYGGIAHQMPVCRMLPSQFGRKDAEGGAGLVGESSSLVTALIGAFQSSQ